LNAKGAPDLGELELSKAQFVQFKEHLQGEDYRTVSPYPC